MSSNHDDLATTPPRIYWLISIALGCLAAAILYHSLPWGIGVSPDSVAYLKSATKLAADFQIQHFPRHWPPAYPLFLMLGVSVIGDMLLAALYGQVMLFALNTLLFSRVTLYCLGARGVGRYWIATIAAAIFACNPSVLLVHQYAVSEALFVFFLLSSLCACFRFVDGGRIWQFFFAALVVGCLAITRYAGLPFLFFFGAFIFLFWHTEEASVVDRVRLASVFVLLCAVPVVAWLGLNFILRGEITDISVVFHPINESHLIDIGSTLSGWFELPLQSEFSWLAMICIGGGVCFSMLALPVGSRQKSLIFGLLVSAMAYAVFLLVSISFIDANVPLDQRILLPCWIFLVLAIAVSLHVSLIRPTHFVLLVIPVALVAMGYGLKSSGQIGHSVRQGLGYQTRSAHESELLQLVRELHAQRVLYSNARDYIYLHTGLEVQPIPAIYDAATRRPHADFIVRMAGILEKIDKDTAAIVYFKGFEFRQYYPTRTQLESEFGLSGAIRFRDGAFYYELDAQ